VVINAQTGIETVTQRMMEYAQKQRLCRMIVVNKIEAEGTRLAELLADIRENFGPECLPINLPANSGTTVADCFFSMSDESPDFSSVADAHTEIIDQVVELDDELMELYLEQGEDISVDQLHAPFERALRRGHLIPVCFVSAETGAGLRQLLSVFSSLMPNPAEGNPPQFRRGEGPDAEILEVRPEESGHFVGHIVKVNVDPYIGRLGIFRVHQGRISSGEQVFVGERRKSVRMAHIYRLQGKDTIEVPVAVPGDIAAIAKVEEVHFDAVLHDSHDEDELHMRSLNLPPPMYGVALELTRRGDEKKLSEALHKLTAEDPSLLVEHHAQANETVLRGMGEMHLRVILERMAEEFGLEVDTHPPKIAYRETVRRKAEGHHRHKKQTGGAGQFGEVFLRIEPTPRDSGFEFENKVVGGSIPSQFIPAVEKGIRQVLDEGAVAGYPMQDIKVTVYDGKHHPVDSKEVAFVAAGKKAFVDAVTKAKPVVLEPIARVEVTAPANNVGDITGHLSGSRGRISGSDSISGNRVQISAQVPVSELGDYQTTLKSITGGEGTYTMQFDHYAAVPPPVQKTLESDHQPREEH
jgi:elongation factor G